MSHYAKGRRAEYEVKNIFEKAGWQVTRAAASQGPWDLIAIKITQQNKKRVFVIALMQVKSEKR